MNSPSFAREAGGRRSLDCETSPGHNSQYYTAATERVETRRTPSCLGVLRRCRWSNSATKGAKSSDEKNEVDAKADSIRHSPSSSKRSTQKTKERKILVFSTWDSDGETSVYESVRTKTRQNKGRSASRSNSREKRSISRERGKTKGSANNSPKNRARSSAKKTVVKDTSDSSSSSDEESTKTSTLTKPKHILKPPKFDGLASFETFWAQFKNCAEHNQWDQTQKLGYLKSSLDKEVANVLWDYGKEVTESLSGLTKILKTRSGGKNFADKHRIEIRNRRRTATETLQSLHIDMRKLAALAFPNMDHRTRKVISCDYFLDALADPDFALKIRERHPEV